MAGKQVSTDTVEYIDPKTGEVTMVTPEKFGELQAADAAAMYAEDSGAGFENQTSDDVSIPLLIVAQPGSPEVTAEGSEIKAGTWMNRTTGDMYPTKDGGFKFIPVFTDHKYVEWIPKDPKTGEGGGYVGEYPLDHPLVNKITSEQPLGKYKHPNNGNDIVETFYAYGLVITPDGSYYGAIIPFASTFIKEYKGWMFKARSLMIQVSPTQKVKAPLFAHVYQFKSAQQKKGTNTWYTPLITFADGKPNAADVRLLPQSELYQAAKAFKEVIETGGFRVDKSQQDQAGGPAADNAPEKGDINGENAPY